MVHVRRFVLVELVKFVLKLVDVPDAFVMDRIAVTLFTWGLFTQFIVNSKLLTVTFC